MALTKNITHIAKVKFLEYKNKIANCNLEIFGIFFGNAFLGKKRVFRLNYHYVCYLFHLLRDHYLNQFDQIMHPWFV